MPPVLVLIRHGEAEHNATKNWSIPDPELTELGRQQCRELEEHLRTKCPEAQQIEAIVTSPFIRTIQTTLIGLDWLVKKGITVEANALWQENAAKPCDTGSRIDVLRGRFPEINLDNLDPVFPQKTLQTKYAFTRTKVLARGQMALKELYTRTEKMIAVVSHSGFLRTAVTRRRYANADYRIFRFGDDMTLQELSDPQGGMSWSEPGVAELEERDFPAEADAEATQEKP